MATFHLFSRWRKKSLAIVLASFAQSLYAQQTIVDTELLGLASQTDASSFIANPATMHLKNERYRYSLNSATGGYFNDKNGLLDDFEDAEEEGERIRELSNERLLFPSDFERQ
ncbi:hypothetical protein, partial [Litorivivens sp.]